MKFKNKKFWLSFGAIALSTTPMATVVACGNDNNTTNETPDTEDTPSVAEDHAIVEAIKTAIGEPKQTWLKTVAEYDKIVTDTTIHQDFTNEAAALLGIEVTVPANLQGVKLKYDLREKQIIEGLVAEYTFSLYIIKGLQANKITMTLMSDDKVTNPVKEITDNVKKEIEEITQISKKTIAQYEEIAGKTLAPQLLTEEVKTSLGVQFEGEVSDLNGASLWYDLITKTKIPGRAAEFIFTIHILIGNQGSRISAVLLSSDICDDSDDLKDVTWVKDEIGTIVAPTTTTYETLFRMASYSQTLNNLINTYVLKTLGITNTIPWQATTRGVKVQYKLIDSEKVAGEKVKFTLTIVLSKGNITQSIVVDIFSSDVFVPEWQKDADDVDFIKNAVARAKRLNWNSISRLQELATSTDQALDAAAIEKLGISLTLPENMRGVNVKYKLTPREYYQQVSGEHDIYDFHISFSKNSVTDTLGLEMRSFEQYTKLGPEQRDVRALKDQIGQPTSTPTLTMAQLDDRVQRWNLTDNNGFNHEWIPHMAFVVEELGINMNLPEDYTWTSNGVYATRELRLISKEVGQRAKYLYTTRLHKDIKEYGIWVTGRVVDYITVEVESTDIVTAEATATTAEINRVKRLLSSDNKIKCSNTDADIWLPSEITNYDFYDGGQVFKGWKNYTAGTVGFVSLDRTRKPNDETGEVPVIFTTYPLTPEAGSIQSIQFTLTGFESKYGRLIDDNHSDLSHFLGGHQTFTKGNDFTKSSLTDAQLDAMIGKEYDSLVDFKIARFYGGGWNWYPTIHTDDIVYTVEGVRGSGEVGKAYTIKVVMRLGTFTSQFTFILRSTEFRWEV